MVYFTVRYLSLHDIYVPCDKTILQSFILLMLGKKFIAIDFTIPIDIGKAIGE